MALDVRVIVTDASPLIKIVLLTTSDFLRQLERAHRIQSADQVLDAARRADLNPSTRDIWSRHDPEVGDAVKAVLEDARRRSSRSP